MTINFWLEFGILFAATLVGSAAVLPYSLRLLPKDKPLKMSMPKVVLLSLLQGAVIFAIATGVGLLAAHSIGLGAPYLEAALAGNGSAQALVPMLQVAIILGVLAGIILLIGDLLFLPYWPEALVDTARTTTLWENFAASFYGGINEEILIRLLGLSALAWLFSRIWHTSAGLPTNTVFWVANVLMAIIFGIGHLPALKNLLGRIPPLMLARSLLLNAPIGLICGWLFWTYGIEAAIVAHFAADIVYHVFGTVVFRRKLGTRPL
jgi:Type II CAAX prenyl endopeptidase Rce1-like